MDNINSLIRKASDIDVSGAGNPNLKDSDVAQIWDEVSSYINKMMTQSRGVSIPNFGTFSFVQKKIDIGNNKFILAQRPVFAIAEKFSQTHGLTCTKYPVSGHIPVHPLNYIAIANETPFTRDDVEQCVRHVLQVFNRSLQAKKNIEFTFTNIGKLQIRNNKVKMKFFKDFVNFFDSSGKVLNEMQNRPNTADSVMSRNDLDRPHTRNTCVLPRITRSSLDGNLNNQGSFGLMDTINEEGSNEINILRIESPKPHVPIASICSTDEITSNVDTMFIHPQEAVNTTPQATRYHIPDAFPVVSKSTPNLSATLQPAGSTSSGGGHSNNGAVHLTAGEAVRVNAIMSQYPTGSSVCVPNTQSPSQLARPSSKSLLNNLLMPRPGTSHAVSSCGHANAGQELCYLCHQRARRNVPVYLHEEQKQKEKEENQLLSQYQQLKDMEKQLEDEEKLHARRLDRAKMDAFNVGISEALREKRKQRPKTSDLSRSFIFRKRCKTPPKYVKQADLSEYLTKQIEDRRSEESRSKKENEYLERMERLQLAEELAAQREAYLKEKNQRQNDLRGALDYQVKTKPSELPKALPDGEVFGQYDAKNEKLAQNKRREIEAAKFNLSYHEQQKREELLNQLKDQEIDAENVERVKEEFKIDRANRARRANEMRRGLERDWMFANDDKRQRDYDEREHRLAHDGLLVHEQCDKYRRCAQCTRDLKNCGETNLWKDVRYQPGNRCIV